MAEGDFPEWNEILSFPLKSDFKRFTRQELSNMKVMIYISLFDRVINQNLDLTKNNYKFLGSLSIPLISLLNNPPKIEAVLKLERPISLLQYEVVQDRFFYLHGGQSAV
jgi:hypothetical protein